MTTETDCFWVWDTENDKQNAIRLEKRIKENTLKEIEDKIEKLIKRNLEEHKKIMGEYFSEDNWTNVESLKELLRLIKGEPQ